MVHVEWNNNLY